VTTDLATTANTGGLAIQFLMSRTLQRDEESCWPWLGKSSSLGYGQIVILGKSFYAHRVAYECHYGPIADGDVVRHECDHPWCVNPYHLRSGTQADNLSDMRRKHRHNFGQRNGMAKLRDNNIPTIFAMRSQGMTHQEIAMVFGVSPRAIGGVLKGQGWTQTQEGSK
jgi:hypothetical protein